MTRYQSTGRFDYSLSPMLYMRHETTVQRLRRQQAGRLLGATIRQLEADEVDWEDLQQAIEGVRQDGFSPRLRELCEKHLEHCADCQSFLTEQEYYNDNDDLICEDCYGNYFTCYHCDNVCHTDSYNDINREAVCNNCRDEHYSYCEDCEEYCSHDDSYYVDERAVCRYCLENGEYYYHESDCEYHSYPEAGSIHEYNVTLTGPIGTIPSDTRQQHVLGFELEAEIPDREEFAESLAELRDENDCHCKRDGSLNATKGVEIVTGYGTLQNLIPLVDDITKLAREYRGISHNGRDCGLHISLDRRQLPAVTQARLILFFNDTENYTLLRQFTRRDYRRCGYCRTKVEKTTPEFLTDCETSGVASGDKYDVVNTSHRTHLEFRAFKGSLLSLTVRACLSLISLLAEYCDQPVEPSELSSQAFVAWLESVDDLRKQTMLDYLKNRNRSLSELI